MFSQNSNKLSVEFCLDQSFIKTLNRSINRTVYSEAYPDLKFNFEFENKLIISNIKTNLKAVFSRNLEDADKMEVGR